MRPEQQRIMGYFIEEAKEHLNTIEQGLLSLQKVIEEPEMLGEVFRATHSIKGGAAMLGIDSIQQTAHALEDNFKLLKEHPVRVDQKLESLFFLGFDTLQELLEEIQSPFGLTDKVAANATKTVAVVSAELRSHLGTLVSQTSEGDSTDTLELDGLQNLDVSGEEPGVAFTRNPTPSPSQEVDLIAQIFLAGEAPADPLNERVSFEDSLDQLLSLAPSTIKNELDEVLKGTSSGEIPGELEIDGLADFSFELASLNSEDFQGVDPAGEMLPLEQTSGKVPEGSIDHSYSAELEALLAEVNLGEAPSPALLATPQKFPDPDAGLEKLIETETGLNPARAQKEDKTAQPKPQISRRASGNSDEQTLHVSVKQLDSLGNLVEELVVERNRLEQNQERLRESLDKLLYQAQQLNNVSQQMQDLYERSLLGSSLLSASYPDQFPQYVSSLDSPRTAAPQTEPSTGTRFQGLEMNRFTSFHTLFQEVMERMVRLREAASDIELTVDESDQVARMFRQVTTQLQAGLTQSRMVPFAQIAERLPRAVRDIALKCGKRTNLEIEGGEILIDKGILERLYDPITHLVNNTLTHGIELPEVRQSLGKPLAGQIKVQACYQGNQTIISVSDDGAGIDPERVKAKAIEKGLVSPKLADSLSPTEIYNLLFLSGFSTKDQVDDLAGRGVGLDVVRTSLDEIRGAIRTDSTLGKGTTFTIRLPLTLSIAKALFCVDNHYRIAFPLDGVEEVLKIPEDLIQFDAEGNPVLEWRNLLLPLRPLSELLTYNRRLSRGHLSAGNQDENLISVVILQGAGHFLAVQVGQALGEQEVVMKQLPGPVPKPVGLAGVTVLGDGRIMPIADVLELIDLATGKLAVADTLWHHGATTEPAPKTEPLVLIVDDSITVREILSKTFNKLGYRVEQAREGQEAWEKLQSGLPCDLVFCDIEMPRMEGLELLARIQQDPLLNHLPVVILTSRGAERHRQMAIQLGAKGYFTKPYLEEALLDAAQRLLKGEVLAS